MAERYRFQLPSGEVYESDRGKAWIGKTYPGAVITGRVAFDAVGAGTVVPYRGEQPPAADETDNAPESEIPGTQGDDGAKTASRAKRAR